MGVCSTKRKVQVLIFGRLHCSYVDRSGGRGGGRGEGGRPALIKKTTAQLSLSAHYRVPWASDQLVLD